MCAHLLSFNSWLACGDDHEEQPAAELKVDFESVHLGWRIEFEPLSVTILR
jgi:hypothetical protein